MCTNQSHSHIDGETKRGTETEWQRMLSSYAELSNKFLQYINNPTSPTTFTSAQATSQADDMHTF